MIAALFSGFLNLQPPGVMHSIYAHASHGGNMLCWRLSLCVEKAVLDEVMRNMLWTCGPCGSIWQSPTFRNILYLYRVEENVHVCGLIWIPVLLRFCALILN